MVDQKIKKLQLFFFFYLKTYKNIARLSFMAPLEGSTIFLHRSSLGYTALESCQIAGLKYETAYAKRDLMAAAAVLRYCVTKFDQ